MNLHSHKPMPNSDTQIVACMLAILNIVEDNDHKLKILELLRSAVERTTLAPEAVVRSTLTAEAVEARQYTLVSTLTVEGKCKKFLVSSVDEDEALKLAQRYVGEKGWKLNWYCDALFQFWPGDFLKKARKLFAAGKYI